MRVSQAVLEVLDRATTDGPSLHLVGQFDRKLYTDVAKVLELAGGKWNRKAGAHVFPHDAGQAVEQIILTGEITDLKKELQAFNTPEPLAAYVVAEASISPGMKVLEPNAGEGALARPARDAGGEVTCVEINAALHDHLRFTTGEAHCGDFMMTDVVELGGPFDRVVMNPPFAKQQDALHLLHAYGMLKPGGRLVCIMAASVTFRDTQLYRDVRDLVANTGGRIKQLEAGAFKESGTMVNTVLVILDAPAAPEIRSAA